MSEFRNDLARARGLGSAHHGTSHFIAQRVSAIILLPLSLWFLIAVANMDSYSYNAVSDWLVSGVNGFLLATLIGVVYYHLQSGLQVVIEDYIHCHAKKMLMLFVVKTACLLLAASSVFAILRF